MDREDVLKRLKHLDMAAFLQIKDNKRYQCIIVGGGAYGYSDFIKRAKEANLCGN